MHAPAKVLSHALVVAEGARPEHFILLLHGIFGSGANWRTFARRLVAARPTWGAVLVDLRMHGQSQHFGAPHTLPAAAEDLVRLEAALPGPVAGVLGHSFGGKVALAYVDARGPGIGPAIIVDSNPGARPDQRGSASTLRMLHLLETMPRVAPSREAFIRIVEEAGHDRAIGQWLAMNLRPAEGGFAFRSDLRAIRDLLDDYFDRDLWRVLESPPEGTHVRLVVGGRSDVLDLRDRARAVRAAEASPERVSVVVVPEAGHWVHVDAPDALFAAVVEML